MDWTEKSASEQGRAIERGELDPVELTQSYLDKIAAHPLGDRIYARVTPDRALAEAEAASRRAKLGQRLSPLDGVPISWKDLFDTAGIVTEAGSDLLQGRVPESDALVLQVATAMGLVCLGKTHMSELAFSGLGLNPVKETPPCVNDPDAVSGGSSSGAAASVAFGLAAAAIGSDTGGSVRIPSAWNDLVGLKTTSGRLSLQGVVPLCKKFDTVGPLCRTVEDAALVLAALEGRKAADLRGVSLQGVRLATLQNVVLDEMEPEIAENYQAVLGQLAEAGIEIVPIEVPEIAGSLADSGVLYTVEAWAEWGEEITAQPDVMFPAIRERFEAGQNASGVEYLQAWKRLEQARAAYSEATKGFDAVITPSSPIFAPKADRLLEQGEYYVRANLLSLRNTRVGNLMGLSSISLPTSLASCGILLNAGPMQEERLLRLAAGVEQVLRGDKA